MVKKINLAVLVSGGGTNLQAIIDTIEQGKLSARIQVVISNNAQAYALVRAQNHNIPVRVIDHRDYKDRKDFEKALVKEIDSRLVDLVVLAGFMRVLTPYFIKKYWLRLINIHPALLPSFPGVHVQKKAVDYGVRFSGCTVHFVDEGTDTGPIIIQAIVPVLDSDDEDTLARRILKEEHKIYPRAIQLFAQRRLKVVGRRVIIEPPLSPQEGVMFNPPLEG